ncbi:hypothetical protein ACJJTC_001337 [Scirpophaga incertulas]
MLKQGDLLSALTIARAPLRSVSVLVSSGADVVVSAYSHGKSEVDTGRVIDEVRLRKILWDASDPLYKYKDARNKAWEDIVDALFENISGEEKQQLVKLVQQRWKTARDAFFRTKNAIKKTPSGSAAPKYKKYIYYEELSFLAPTVENEVDESLNDSSLPSPSVNIDNTLDSMGTSENTQDSDILMQQVFSNTQLVSRLTVVLIQHHHKNLDLAADDLAFFASLGPILKSFDVGQKLEFRRECYEKPWIFEITTDQIAQIALTPTMQDMHHHTIVRFQLTQSTKPTMRIMVTLVIKQRDSDE